jgi:hypothetical protein
MKTPQQDVLAVLLKSIYEQNLISENLYRNSLNTLHSGLDFLPFLQYNVPLQKDSSVKMKEGNLYGCAQNTQ